MATTVSQHQVSAITDPADGSALSASVMRGVSSTLRSGLNAHDADAGVHLQSSVAASRPAAGEAGRKWLDTDTLLVKYDTGSTWSDLAYLKSSGGTLSGALTISSGGLTVSADGITVTGNSTITGTLGGLTGLTVASGGAAVTGNSSVAGTLAVTTGKTTLAATAAGYASLNLPHGTAPSSPASGDVWTTTGGVFANINGTTGQLVSTATVLSGAYGVEGGGQPTAITLTASSWSNPLRFPNDTTKGANPPTFSANRDVITIVETGWYVLTAHTKVSAGSPSGLGLRWSRASGTGSNVGDSGAFVNYWGGFSHYPMRVSCLCYAEANSTWKLEAYTSSSGVDMSVQSFAISRVG